MHIKLHGTIDKEALKNNIVAMTTIGGEYINLAKFLDEHLIVGDDEEVTISIDKFKLRFVT